MAISESLLLKILEHRTTPKNLVFNIISQNLDLQYFFDDKEAQIHTISGLNFVIDISEVNLKIIFVEEDYSKSFKYVEFYLWNYLRKSDFKNFYFYLKMFTNLEKGTENVIEKENRCTCIYNDTYCCNPSFENVVSAVNDGIYNIYNHRFEYHLFFSDFLFTFSTKQAIDKNKIHGKTNVIKAKNKEDQDVYAELGENMAAYFPAEIYSKDITLKLPKYNYYWKDVINGKDIFVSTANSVFVDNNLEREISFLFKKGKTLRNSLTFFS